ncbi:MAG: GspE/PulE family protein, partial [Pyrinomonadaceae bacterium]
YETIFGEAIGKEDRMMIFSGPTGSGKTAIQCSILRLLNGTGRNILTAEWPVEYSLHGVNQVDCKFDIGYSDAVAMRAFLEQNPDVIMVKLEDGERSRLAFRIAEKGSLVLGAMHVPTTATVFERLRNMGIPAFDLSTYVSIVQAQRLVRRLCPDCKVQFVPSAALLENLKVDEQLLERLELPAVPLDTVRFYKHGGCEKCSGSGYTGRALICESLKMTSKLQDMILHGSKAAEIEKAAVEDGMITLRQAGLRQVILGNTAIEEAMLAT